MPMVLLAILSELKRPNHLFSNNISEINTPLFVCQSVFVSPVLMHPAPQLQFVLVSTMYIWSNKLWWRVEYENIINSLYENCIFHYPEIRLILVDWGYAVPPRGPIYFVSNHILQTKWWLGTIFSYFFHTVVQKSNIELLRLLDC